MHHTQRRLENLLGVFASAVAEQIADATATAAGQGGGAPAALVQIADHPDVTIEELRRRLGLSHSSVVRLLDRLAVRGLVRRSRGQVDARTARLRLTSDGATAAESVLRARSAVIGRVVGRLSPRDRRDLERLLDEMLRNEPLTPDGASQLCRLCCLRDCPADRCPVEQRYRELLSQGR
jgi:DNA-binding MarR family transcriptional regulator